MMRKEKMTLTWHIIQQKQHAERVREGQSVCVYTVYARVCMSGKERKREVLCVKGGGDERREGRKQGKGQKVQFTI